MNKKTLSPFATAFGAAFIASAAFAPLAMADASFSAKPLPVGYNLAAAETEGKCGEGKCGEGKCGEETQPAEKKSDEEGKCGEGKCAADHAHDKGVEKSDGDNKSTEGKCGEGKCGEGKCGH